MLRRLWLLAMTPVFWIVPSIFFLDRIVKLIIVNRYAEGGGFAVLPGVFHVTRVNNKGAAFGMLKNYGNVLIVVSVACVIFLGFYLVRKASSSGDGLIKFAWSLVLAGALGNLYDRLRYGYVVDYLDFRVWPVFNVADASICVGAGLAAIYFLNKSGVPKGS